MHFILDRSNGTSSTITVQSSSPSIVATETSISIDISSSAIQHSTFV
jgi:hypothetical protein